MATATKTFAGVTAAVGLLSANSVGAVVCQPSDPLPTIRWASSSDRLYLEGGGCTNLTSIFYARSDQYGIKGPLYPFNSKNNTFASEPTGTWYLNSSLYIEDGSMLDISGPSVGGDCEELLLTSSPEKFINVRAYGGMLHLEQTEVKTWDRGANGGEGGVDENVDDGRSYLSAISEVVMDPTETCDGKARNTMGEARMDILSSNISYLGYYYSESYGITYKVRGLCKDLSNLEIFDKVSVRGDIINSHIHHNYFGHYSYGHEGGNWSYNEVHDNFGYGFDPHDDSDSLTIHGNHVYNNGWHGIIASKRCDHLSIQDNIVHDNGGNGIMLHRSCDYSTVSGNTAFSNGDAGLALYESSYVEVAENFFFDNVYGIRWSMGASYCDVHDNEVHLQSDSDTDAKYAIFMYRGNDEVGVEGTTGRPQANHIYNNYLLAESEVLKVTDSDFTVIQNNTIMGEFARFRNTTETLFSDNSLPVAFDLLVEGDITCFESGSDSDLGPDC